MQAQCQPRVSTRLQVAPCLSGVERAPLEKDVGRLRHERCVRKDLGEREVEVRVGIVELGRHRVRAEPRGNPAGGTDGTQLLELGVTIESVARLSLERRRPVGAHPASVAQRRCFELGLRRRSRRGDRREDAAAGGVQLLVGRTSGTERELVDPVTREARVGVAVDEPGKR